MDKNRKFVIMWVFEFAVAIMLSLSIVYYLQSSITKSKDLLEHSQKCFTAIDKILISMLNGETGQRGYVITGNERYLNPYNTALTSIEDDLNNLKYFYNDERKFDELARLINDKFVSMDEAIAKKRKGLTENVLNPIGIEIMDKIRSNIYDMKRETNKVLAKRKEDLQSDFNRMTVLLPTMVLGNFLLVLVVYYSVNSSIVTQQNKVLGEYEQYISKYGVRSKEAEDFIGKHLTPRELFDMLRFHRQVEILLLREKESK